MSQNELKFDDLQILKDSRYVVKVHLKDSISSENPVGLLIQERKSKKWDAVMLLGKLFESSSINPYILSDKQCIVARDKNLDHLKKKLQANIHLISANLKAFSTVRDPEKISNSCTDYWRNTSPGMKFKNLAKTAGHTMVKYAMITAWLDTFKNEKDVKNF